MGIKGITRADEYKPTEKEMKPYKELEKEFNLSEKIRTNICNIISRMLDNPDECEIYPTTKCYDELERYIKARDKEFIKLLKRYFTTKQSRTFIDKFAGPKLI